MIEGSEIIEGQAFDLEAVLVENNVPTVPKRASPGIKQKILASFEYSRHQANRFNDVGDEGAYYAGTTLPAAIHEIKWHLENDHGIAFDRTRVYRVVTARVSGRFLDLRDVDAKALHPDVEIGYPAGQKLARQASQVVDGIIYPSVRHDQGTCIAVFNPDTLSNIMLDRCISFEPVPGSERKFGYRMHAQPHHYPARSLSSKFELDFA